MMLKNNNDQKMLRIITSQEEVNRDLTGPSEEGQPHGYTTVRSLFSTFENKRMLTSGTTWSLLRTILGDTSSTPMQVNSLDSSGSCFVFISHWHAVLRIHLYLLSAANSRSDSSKNKLHLCFSGSPLLHCWLQSLTQIVMAESLPFS